MKIALRVAVAAVIFSACAAVAQSPASAPIQSPPSSSSSSAASSSTTRKALRAASRAEWKAYRSAVAQSDPAKLEAQATEFAQKFPASPLRPYLFQRAMALYERANQPAKSLQMAREVLKYDPGNPAALTTAALILANGARDSDLDRNARLEEAHSDALQALRNVAKLDAFSGLSEEQRGELSEQLSAAAHEALGTVAFKKLDFATALKEYYIAMAEQKQHTDPVLLLRMSVAYEKTGNLAMSADAAEKAIQASAAGSRVRELAERQKTHIQKKSAAAPGKGASATPAESSTGARKF